ncbi:MAG: sigma-54-dependent Fis family transcriptional regulator [Saprospiraceae bacterium]|nr:sigma-54-dependent Fis family transcriptional regulator [Saprospiraceae bacterium]
MENPALKNGKILIVDDNEDVLQAARLFLKQYFAEIVLEKNPELLPRHLENDFDVVLLDMNFTKDVSSGYEGFHWLEKIQEINPSVIVILITAYGDVEMAVRAIKAGATDFVLKPWNNAKLLATLLSAMDLRRSRLQVERLLNRTRILDADTSAHFGELLGISPAMQEVFTQIQKVAKTDADIIILGENGTGKELVARAIHHHSLRMKEVFVRVDLGALSENLFESELFGHVKGAFTDAREDRAGRFEVASGGTLFLDEIGNVPMLLQSKLLTVLQTRQITRVGSNKNQSIDIRLICATNMPLYDMVARNEFRQDLLYRINTIEIHLPPLRERPEDIELLAKYFIRFYAKKYRKPVQDISHDALQRLCRYAFPGNVRELQHIIERAVIMSDGETLSNRDFAFSLKSKTSASQQEIALDSFNLEDLEKAVIQKVVKKFDGNITRAARELGLTRASLYRRLEKYGL